MQHWYKLRINHLHLNCTYLKTKCIGIEEIDKSIRSLMRKGSHYIIHHIIRSGVIYIIINCGKSFWHFKDHQLLQQVSKYDSVTGLYPFMTAAAAVATATATTCSNKRLLADMFTRLP